MSKPTNPTALAALALLIVGLPGTLAAQVADPDPERFSDAFADFASWDAENYVPQDGIVFIGSSSINYWRTAESFPGLPVINRGFGGSHASDVVHWVHDGVLKYDPAVVVVYEGDNDITQGKSAEQVMEDFHDLVHAVHTSGSDAEVLFLSIKPSPARMDAWPEMQRANAMLKSFADGHDTVHYADVGSDLLDASGKPIMDMFVADGIHMTPAGYTVWNRVLGNALGRILH